MSKLIVIEGPDRVGKATQAEILRQNLVSKGHRVAKVEVPVDTNFAYHVVYWMLRSGLASMWPTTFQVCQYLNRRIFQRSNLPQLENDNDYIIMDRWSLSTVAYGAATGVSPEFTKKLYDRLRHPDFTIILLGPSYPHEAEDVYEADAVLQRNVRRAYEEWASMYPGRSAVVDCARGPMEVAADIVECLVDSGTIDE